QLTPRPLISPLLPYTTFFRSVAHPLEELARGGALDDAVVVGRGQGHDLRDRELGEGRGARALELRGIVHRADSDDDALSLHEAGDRKSTRLNSSHVSISYAVL